jgi:hypothetical protein
MHRSLLILFCLLVSAAPSFAQDDVLEKIRVLEQQIQELKLLKEQQAVASVKFDDCMKATAREKFCSCLRSNLPAEVGFEQYIHILVTPREKIGYGTMPDQQRKTVDATIAARESCIEKGFFK